MTINYRSGILEVTQLVAVCFALFMAPSVMGQKLKMNILEEAKAVLDYPKVILIYEDIEASGKATPDVLRDMALTYQHLNQPKKAEAVYTKLMSTGAQKPGDILAYADQLRANGRYDEAIEWYGNYVTVNPEDKSVDGYAKDPTILKRLMQDSTGSVVRKLSINSPQADLGMTVMDNLLVFSSARGEGAGGKRIYKWDDQPYLNLYSAILKGENAVDPIVMRNNVNSRYHDGTVSYDSTHQRMYFTRDNMHYGTMLKSEDGYLNLGIYYIDVVTGEYGQQEWDALIPFEHNDQNYNFGHPFVSRDGMLLFFVSDKPGGQGGTDIYVCKSLGKQWGAPENLGPVINTPGNEMFPYLRKDSTLFFTSTGHPGLGEMDNFSARLTPQGALRVRNLGPPLNTRFNDHGLIFINDTTGFFSSDRPGGEGSDDIYGCTVYPEALILAGVVVNKNTREAIDGASFELVTVSGDPIEIKDLELTDGGKFRIKADFHDKYVLKVSKPGYLATELPINSSTDDLENLIVELEKFEYAVEGVVVDAKTREPIVDAIVVLTDADDEHIKSTNTDAQGRYSFALNPQSDYRIRVGKKFYFKQSAFLTTKNKPSQTFTKDFELMKLAVDEVIRLDNIFYDYNKADIRPDAAKELDILVETLKENPSVVIELSSHTDCRGKDAYNLALSERRAKSAVDYIIGKGIPKDNIASKGYGESKPSEDCECTKCSDDQHQRNRRSEFKVLSL